jgi:hypothetical protein
MDDCHWFITGPAGGGGREGRPPRAPDAKGAPATWPPGFSGRESDVVAPLEPVWRSYFSKTKEDKQWSVTFYLGHFFRWLDWALFTLKWDKTGGLNHSYKADPGMLHTIDTSFLLVPSSSDCSDVSLLFNFWIRSMATKHVQPYCCAKSGSHGTSLQIRVYLPTGRGVVWLFLGQERRWLIFNSTLFHDSYLKFEILSPTFTRPRQDARSQVIHPR